MKFVANRGILARDPNPQASLCQRQNERREATTTRGERAFRCSKCFPFLIHFHTIRFQFSLLFNSKFLFFSTIAVLTADYLGEPIYLRTLSIDTLQKTPENLKKCFLNSFWLPVE